MENRSWFVRNNQNVLIILLSLGVIMNVWSAMEKRAELKVLRADLEKAVKLAEEEMKLLHQCLEQRPPVK